MRKTKADIGAAWLVFIALPVIASVVFWNTEGAWWYKPASVVLFFAALNIIKIVLFPASSGSNIKADNRYQPVRQQAEVKGEMWYDDGKPLWHEGEVIGFRILYLEDGVFHSPYQDTPWIDGRCDAMMEPDKVTGYGGVWAAVRPEKKILQEYARRCRSRRLKPYLAAVSLSGTVRMIVDRHGNELFSGEEAHIIATDPYNK